MDDVDITNNIYDKYRVLKRALHIIALLEIPGFPTYNEKDGKINYSKLAELFSLEDESGEVLSEKVVKTAIRFIRELFGLDVITKRGRRHFEGGVKGLTKEMEAQLMEFYSNFVVKDLHKKSIIASIQNRKPLATMWIFANLYFAIKQKIILEIEYKKMGGEEITKHIVHPYHIIFHRNSYYLVAFFEKHNDISLLKIKFISSVQYTNRKFEEDIPILEDIYKHSLDAYIRKGEIYDVRLSIHQKAYEEIMDILLPLSPKEIGKRGNFKIVEFKIKDRLSLYRELFLYTDYIEIIEPELFRDELYDYARKLIEKYSKNIPNKY